MADSSPAGTVEVVDGFIGLAPTSTCYLLTIEAEPQHQITGSVLDLLVSNELLPRWFSARLIDDNRLRIVVELDVPDYAAVEGVARRAASLRGVTDVSRTMLTRRAQITP